MPRSISNRRSLVMEGDLFPTMETALLHKQYDFYISRAIRLTANQWKQQVALTDEWSFR